MNVVALIGRLTRDPELRYIPGSGTAVARFTLAVDKQLSKDKKRELEEKNQPTADFINVTVWGRQAEVVANHLRKGLLTGVQGRIQTGRYEDKTGQMRYTTEVVASHVNFLEWPSDGRDQGDYYGQGGGYQQGGYQQGGYQQQGGGYGGPGVPQGQAGNVDGFYPIDDQDDNIPF